MNLPASQAEGYVVAVRGWGRRAGKIRSAVLIADTPEEVQELRERFRRIKQRLAEIQLEPAATMRIVGEWRSS